jgi:group II intron reverse transcriptase/maturase
LTEEHSIPEFSTLFEQVVERDNMVKAYRRVRQNRGAAGIDGMSVEQLHDFLQDNWPDIKARLLSGTYVPQPVRRVEIPKPGGGTRALGVPTVLDRLIQQAILQKLSPLFDPEFSEHSYGFRPGRSAQQAVLQARRYQRAGKRWVVDMDLEKFFDEVSHDILMARVGRKVRDRKVLYLIRLYLQSGVMIGGVVSATPKGTPQGGPLSPLLSNILLDDLDKELERRGHSFCRYADDCNIYVNSRLCAERVMASITRFVETQLKLKVNRAKSAVARPWQRKFLGYSFTAQRKTRIRVPAESVKRFRRHLKQLFRKGRGRNLAGFIRYDLNPSLRGWINYFCLAENKGFAEDLDKWVRRRLRLIVWRQWKRTWTRFRNLMKRGIAEERAAASASNGRGSWYNAGASHMNQALPKKYFDGLGLMTLLGQLRRFGI